MDGFLGFVGFWSEALGGGGSAACQGILGHVTVFLPLSPFLPSTFGSENGLDQEQDLVASCRLHSVADIALEY
jgi:hypothetical protein